MNLTNVINDSFTQYSAAVLQSRALVDVRDCCKPSARQIFYCMYTDKFVHNKPFQKTLKAIGSAMRLYIHGDASCEGIIMRAGQNFAMRYPLIEVEGNAGNLIASGNYAAPRYTAARLASITENLFKDLDKETIIDWKDNYDNTEQYPMVLPSKGFYNIVNGNFGIAVGASSSIPQYNIKDINNALIYLIDHPDCSFEDIYCAPDFATGAVLINEKEVKESMKNGQGFACKLRSVVEFDQKERCFVVTEIPYSVYTNTICGELEEIIDSEENPGIERFNDLTGSTPLIKIYLAKKANPDKVLKYLYKKTSLQYYYSINFTMLDNGRFPRVFTWKEMLQAHIDHEREVYRRGFEYDLRKIENRIHIIEGILICLARIDEVIATIKASSSAATASTALQTKFLLDAEQAKAVLDMKLSRLAHLEVKKLEDERTQLAVEANRIHSILNNEELFKEELKNGWREIIKIYGDARRTKILNLDQNNDEPIEVKTLQLNLTNKGNIYTSEVSSLYVQKRGGVGNKFKMETGEYIIASSNVESNEQMLFFTDCGNVYHCSSANFIVGERTYLNTCIPIKDFEKVCAMTANEKEKHIMFITKNGLLKKSELAEYNTNRNTGLRAITLTNNDTIVDVLFGNEPNIGILTKYGNFIMISTKDVRAVGRTAQGIHAIKLNDGDEVVSAHIIPSNAKFIASVSSAGLFKKTNVSEFTIQGKNTKGSKLQKLTDNDYMSDFTAICDDGEILVASTKSCIKLTTNDIPIFLKGAQGNKSIKISEKDSVVAIIAY